MKFFTFYTKRGSLWKYFKLTPRGEDGFEEKRKEWRFVIKLIDLFLEGGEKL
ncbi:MULTISPECIES: hypothetical protein [unclassified Sporosarcina]|uniref:hypothetical protein n=1 Tax=unclassified Sporosarcina TaxID=2647733 RepID=UPI002102573B|nr:MULTISPECIES: hypothetical protein [unclassified Sporosarcina]